MRVLYGDTRVVTSRNGLDLRKRMSTQDAPAQSFPRMASVDHGSEQQTMGMFLQISRRGA